MPIDEPTLIRALLRDRAKLHSFIWTIVHDSHLAEDVLQEVMVLVLQRRDRIEDEVHLPRWTRRAARLIAFATLRKTRSNPITLDQQVIDLLEQEWDKLDRTESSVAMEALRQCLGKLAPKAARLIQMRYGEGATSGEIAARLQQQANTVYVGLGRAHKALTECVKRELRKRAPCNG